MKRMRSTGLMFAVSALALALLAGCYRQDIRTLIVEVPQMGSPECSKLIQDALSTIGGVLAAHPDIQSRIVSVTYDSRKLSIKNVEYVIAGVGFDANDAKAKADARANLPEACR